jgi:hypothetical protein
MAAFLHSTTGAFRVAGGVALAGALLAAALLPSRPAAPGTAPVTSNHDLPGDPRRGAATAWCASRSGAARRAPFTSLSEDDKARQAGRARHRPPW